MFDPRSVQEFRFTSCCFDEETGTAIFGYAFDDNLHFSETYVFPTRDEPLDPATRAAVDRALFLLSLVAGISYYKAALPPVASIETGPVTDDEVTFLRTLYFEGLGEFSYVNQVSLQDRPEWRHQSAVISQPPALDLPARSLVAIGGGKDSVVSVELLRHLDREVVLGSVNHAKAVMGCITASGLPSVHATRTLSSKLFELNAQGALNGHVPITAVVSLTLVVTALLTGCDEVVMSNERSASVGNLNWDGREVNHQYSKGLKAEEALANVVRRSVAPNLAYFSLLRPLSELDIARRFAREDRYDSVFTSCNRAFRIDEKRRSEQWCADCDKCRFVFLALAPNMSPKRLKKIFKTNMFDDATQIPGFEALCGWNAAKPFECVGEVEESIAAFLLAADDDEWGNTAVVQHMITSVIPQMDLPTDITARPFVPSPQHHVPDRYLEALGLTEGASREAR